MNSPADSAAAPDGWEEIRQWRKRMRAELIARRMALEPKLRRAQGRRAKQRIGDRIDVRRHPNLGIYWPIKGEIDVRDLAVRHIEAGGAAGMPVIVTRRAPVEFWRWVPGMKMQIGVWDIPVPPERAPLRPEALIIPLVGFDEAGYRLGYGVGYYDRTLAAASPRPLCIGIGLASARLSTVYPQPHDIPMDVIVTDEYVISRAAPAGAAVHEA